MSFKGNRMAIIKRYTQEHLDAILDTRKELREATQRIKQKPLAKAKGKAKSVKAVEDTERGGQAEQVEQSESTESTESTE